MKFNILEFTGKDTFKKHSFKNFPIGIGRRDDNDLVLNDMIVSRVHCAIYEDSGCIYIADMQSTNGTYLNKKRIEAPHKVKDGDLLLVGKSLLGLSIIKE